MLLMTPPVPASNTFITAGQQVRSYHAYMFYGISAMSVVASARWLHVTGAVLYVNQAGAPRLLPLVQICSQTQTQTL